MLGRIGLKLSGRPLSERSFVIIASVFYLLMGLIKMRHYLSSGRFWAEEGLRFYPDIAASGFPESVFYIFNGHLELMTNLVVLASTWVDLRFAPLVTTYLSFALQSLPILLILCMRHSLHLSRSGVLGVIVVTVGMPHALETWANSINLHFHFAALLGLIIAIPIRDQSRHAGLFRVLVLCCGLSGIPANFLAPVLLYRAWQERERERWVQLGILGACTLVQLALIAMNGTDGRVMVFDPLIYVLVALYHHGYALLFGFPGQEPMADLLRQALAGQWWAMLIGGGSVAVFAWFVIYSSIQSQVRRMLVISAFFLSYAAYVTALGDDRTQMIARIYGGRYFFAPNVLLVVVLFGTLGLRRSRVVTACTVLAAVMALKGVNATFKGPDWRESYQAAVEGNQSEIKIWPRDWYLKLPEGIGVHSSPARDGTDHKPSQ